MSTGISDAVELDGGQGFMCARAGGQIAGYNHACALLTNGTAQCSGRNATGELGDGGPMSQATFGPVLGLP